jgi:hypothetical protein
LDNSFQSVTDGDLLLCFFNCATGHLLSGISEENEKFSDILSIEKRSDLISLNPFYLNSTSRKIPEKDGNAGPGR